MDWTNWQNTAFGMIGKYGADMTVRVTTNVGYSAATDTYASTSNADYPVKALVTFFQKKDIDGKLIQVGDRMILIPAQGLPAALETLQVVQVIHGTKTLNPIRIEPLSPGGTAILYRFHVRG